MYSLVNIATLVRDLARHDRATDVATTLLRAFALTPADIESLEGAPYDPAVASARRQQVLADDSSRPHALQVLAATRDFANDLGLDAYAAAVDVLEHTPIGDLTDLQAFVRRDVLASCWDTTGELSVAWAPRALDVVSDGVLGAYTGDEVLSQPWQRWLDGHPIEPAPTAWSGVVAAVRALSRDALLAPAPADWAPRMHEACWAVHLAGRERAAAITALHALVALVGVWAPQRPPLRAVSMMSAAVHAEVVADVLDSATRDAMSQPLFSASSGSVS